MNTWYPVPKWKVFFDLRQNGSQQYSQPYFNKLNLKGTDGSIRDNDFASISDFKKEKIEVLERLNFRFLPLKDGNITVKDLEARINRSSEEYVALFAVYAQSITKYLSGNSISTSRSKELQTESRNQKVNSNSKVCERSDGCQGNVSEKVYKESSDLSDKNIISKGDKIFEIPVTKNMSIEMNIGELDKENYTVVIMPFEKVMTASDIENGRIQIKPAESMNFTLSKNMSMVMKADDIILNYKTLSNDSEKENVENMNISNKSLKNEVQSLKNKNESRIILNKTYDKGVDNVTKNLPETKDYFDYEDFDGGSPTIGTFPITIEYNDASTKNKSTSDAIASRNKSNLKSTEARVKISNSLDKMAFIANASSEKVLENVLEDASDDLEQQNKNLNGRLQIHSTGFNTSLNSKSPGSDLHEVEFYQRLGPYEVRELNSTQLPFIATFHITVNNRGKRNKTTYMIHVAASQKINNSEDRKNNVANQTVYNERVSSESNRRKRSSASNEYPLAWQKSYQRVNSVREEEIINDKFVSRESSELGNKYPSRTTGVILNKTKGTSSVAGAINLSDLISTGAREKEQGVISQLRKDSDSYSEVAPTISNGNEEFNQRKFNDKFRNKGITESETLDNTNGDGGVKSNQTLHGDRNNGEVALPAVIPSKDSGENHSVPKKSELQIDEKASPKELVVAWEMKILPGGVGDSKRNGIKAGKICHVESDCKEMNGVFNAMGEPEYYKVGYEKNGRFFGSRANAYAKGGGIDTKDLIQSRRFQREIRGKSMSFDGKSNEQKLEKILFLGPRSVMFNSRRINNMKDQLSSLRQSDITTPQLAKSSGDTQRLRSQNSDVYYVYKEQSLRNKDRVSRKYKRADEFLNKNKSGVLKSPRNVEVSNSKNQSPSQQQKFRKKRFTPEFILTENNRNTFSSRNSNTQDYPMNSQNIDTKNPIPPTNYENNNEEQQNFDQHLSQSNSKQNGRVPTTDNRPLYNEPIADPRRGSMWQPRSETPTWIEVNHNDKTFPAKFSSDFLWAMIVPQLIEPVNAKPTRVEPTTRSIIDRIVGANNGQSNQQREINDHEWPNYDWVLIDPVREQDERKKVNTNNPSTEQIPFEIVNRPNQNPNIRTITRPTRKPVFRTTTEPRKSPDSFITHKSVEVPSFHTTVKPWHFNSRWDRNPWSVSYNPWKNQLTTPMMMFGGD